MLCQTSNTKVLLVMGFVQTLMASSKKDESMCCFPTQMEGTFEISNIRGAISFHKGSFAVDYDKGRAIFRHPDSDDVFVLQDFKKKLLINSRANGVCIKTVLTKDATFPRCVPGDAQKAFISLEGAAPGIEDWFVNRPLSTPEEGVEQMYIGVNISNCLPVTIHRFMNVQTRTKSEMFHNVSESIQDPQVLYPDLENCVKSRNPNSGADTLLSLPVVLLLSLVYLSLCCKQG